MPSKELGLYIDRTYKIVRQDLINRFKENGVDLTPEQWVVVSRLESQGKMYQTELANHSFRDKPTVSRIIDLLVKKKIVIRTPDKLDGRRFIISLTRKGEKLVDVAYPIVQESRDRGWTNLTEKEYEDLVRILDKVFTNYAELREEN